jgi:hypothetical protein
MTELDPKDEYENLIPPLGSGDFDIIYNVIRKYDQKEFFLKQSHKIDNDVQFEL